MYAKRNRSIPGDSYYGRDIAILSVFLAYCKCTCHNEWRYYCWCVGISAVRSGQDRNPNQVTRDLKSTDRRRASSYRFPLLCSTEATSIVLLGLLIGRGVFNQYYLGNAILTSYSCLVLPFLGTLANSSSARPAHHRHKLLCFLREDAIPPARATFSFGKHSKQEGREKTG